MAKKKPIKKKSVPAPKKIKRNIVRRTNKKGNAYFYNRRQGKIVSRKKWKQESKRIVKRKEAQKIVERAKVKRRPPRKGTKKYKKWRKRYRHLRKCSKVRAIVYRLYPDIFPTYASTSAFCSFFLKKNLRATLKNIDEAVKEFAQTIAKPDIRVDLLGPWFWFEADFGMQELHDYIVQNFISNLWVRSQLSSMPAFLINEYTYDGTFKEYVDWKNAHQDSNRDEGRDYTELLISLHFNPRKTRWEIFIEEEDEPGGEPYTLKIPYDVLVKEEPKELEGPIVARGGEEKVEKKQRKGKTKKVQQIEKKKLTRRERNQIENEISTLQAVRTYINENKKTLTKQIVKHKKAGKEELYTEALSRLKKIRKEIDLINKKIIGLKTIEKRGYK